MFSHGEYDGHEQLIHVANRESGLRAIIGIHDTSLGPAFGGCRMWPYPDEGKALTDVLRLSRGMTFKSAICELPYGGGKAVIIGDPARDKDEALLLAMGRAVERLGGRYITADDVGTTLSDLAVMRRVTAHTAAATEAARSPLAVTAYGVLMAIEAAALRVLGRSDLAGVHLAVQGLGNVGGPLCGFLHERGAVLTVTDIDPRRVADAQRRLGAHAVAPDEIYRVAADVFVPCALGGVLNDHTIPLLRSKLVCGGANNQLLERRHADALAGRGVVFLPDYLVSAGGVIDFHQERVDDRPAAVLSAVERIRDISNDVLLRASERGETPLAVADAIVHERLAAARRAHRPATDTWATAVT